MHMIHAYLNAPSEIKGRKTTREDRAKHALSTIGVSVLLGGTSTFLGVLVLAFSTSDVFWTFFVMLTSIVVLGLAHGMVFIPVVLSLVGPATGSMK